MLKYSLPYERIEDAVACVVMARPLQVGTSQVYVQNEATGFFY
jgi:hypothetical protein